MMKKWLFTLGVVALLGGAIASAKSYSITLYDRSQLGFTVSQVSGTHKITEIDLGGSKTRLVIE
jgi:hypothetical protein